jgi:hypothetical protein
LLSERQGTQASPVHYSRRDRATSVMMPVKIRERAMAMLDVKSVPNLLGTSVSYAYAVKSGPWIFLTGHEAFDFESGFAEELVHRASRCSGGPAADARAISSSNECGASCRSLGPIWAKASASTNIIRPLLPSIPITSPDTLNSAITFPRVPRW